MVGAGWLLVALLLQACAVQVVAPAMARLHVEPRATAQIDLAPHSGPEASELAVAMLVWRHGERLADGAAGPAR